MRDEVLWQEAIDYIDSRVASPAQIEQSEVNPACRWATWQIDANSYARMYNSDCYVADDDRYEYGVSVPQVGTKVAMVSVYTNGRDNLSLGHRWARRAGLRREPTGWSTVLRIYFGPKKSLFSRMMFALRRDTAVAARAAAIQHSAAKPKPWERS